MTSVWGAFAVLLVTSKPSWCLNLTGEVLSKDGWTGFLLKQVGQNGGFESRITSVMFIRPPGVDCGFGTLSMRLFFSEVGQDLNDPDCQNFQQPNTLKNEVARISFPMQCIMYRSKYCKCYKITIMPTFTSYTTMYLGFDGCHLKGPVRFTYSFSISKMTFTCQTPRSNFPCTAAGVFNRYLRDNERYPWTYHFLTAHVVNFLVTRSKYTPSLLCYQHAVQTICRVKFPRCKDDPTGCSPICRETCEEFCEGCSLFLKTFGSLPNLAGMCPLFATRQENPSCWYKRVDCGAPPPVANATVKILGQGQGKVYFAEYTCDNEFTLHGSASISCYLSGQWSTNIPVCMLRKKIPVLTIVLSCLSGVLLNVIILTTCYFRKELQAVLYVRVGYSIGRRFEIPRKYAAYIVSAEGDADLFVDTYLLPNLEDKYGLRVLASVRDGQLGATLQEDCFYAMKECSRGVFIVDQEFLDTPSLCHLFQQSEEYEKKRRHFRVVVLLDMNCRKQEIRNASLAAYIKSGCFLSPHKRFFIDRLLYSLPSPIRSIRTHEGEVETSSSLQTNVTETSPLLENT